MKIFAIVLFAGLLVVGSSADVCFKSLESVCDREITDNHSPLLCSAKSSHLTDNAVKGLNQLANLQLEMSYKYMLLAAQFNNYVKDRPGFHAHIQALSDRSWEAGQDLIKYMTQRGRTFSLESQNTNLSSANVNEIQVMAMVLDNEKALYEAARHVHWQVSHVGKKDSPAMKSHYDPEAAHHIEEKYLTSLSSSIRKYSGLANDLNNLYTTSKDINMDNYLFDQYLQKA